MTSERAERGSIDEDTILKAMDASISYSLQELQELLDVSNEYPFHDALLRLVDKGLVEFGIDRKFHARKQELKSA